MQYYREIDEEYQALRERKIAHQLEADAIYKAELYVREKQKTAWRDPKDTWDVEENEIQELEDSLDEHHFYYKKEKINKIKNDASRMTNYGAIQREVLPRRLVDFDRDYLYYLRAVAYERKNKLLQTPL